MSALASVWNKYQENRDLVDRHLAGRRLPDLANRGLAKKIGKATCSVNGTRAVTWSAT